jgi:hypothetical protein
MLAAEISPETSPSSRRRHPRQLVSPTSSPFLYSLSFRRSRPAAEEESAVAFYSSAAITLQNRRRLQKICAAFADNYRTSAHNSS